jgi:signal transduction histidine kinase
MKNQIPLLIHIVLVALCVALAWYVASETYFWLVSIWLLLVAVLLIWKILRSTRRAQDDLNNFLLSISNMDFSYAPPSSSRDKYPEMADAYDTINKVFKEISHANESSHRFLKIVVEHTGVALIGYRIQSGEVTLMNKAAKDLFMLPFIKNISAIGQLDSQLLESITSLSSGQRKLLRLRLKGEQLQLTMIAKELVLEGYSYKLISFQDIKSELDQIEISSWQKLIRVLTHEIKNSAIPISTLTEVISSRLIDEAGNPKNPTDLGSEEWEDLSVGIQTIERRSKGLVSFINSYSELSNLPQPELKTFLLENLVQNILQLFYEPFRQQEITLTYDIAKGHEIHADPVQLEQVLINLIKNASEAVSGSDARIHVRAGKVDGRTRIEVIDNGDGMDDESLENIFVPFYTTKVHGTGIGLSMSRQIMRAHKGDLVVISEPGAGSTFQVII